MTFRELSLLETTEIYFGSMLLTGPFSLNPALKRARKDQKEKEKNDIHILEPLTSKQSPLSIQEKDIAKFKCQKQQTLSRIIYLAPTSYM